MIKSTSKVILVVITLFFFLVSCEDKLYRVKYRIRQQNGQMSPIMSSVIPLDEAVLKSHVIATLVANISNDTTSKPTESTVIKVDQNQNTSSEPNETVATNSSSSYIPRVILNIFQGYYPNASSIG